ncbi:hypothetical protein OHA27_34890 [Streptomyces sp. NBC_01619]|uniref:Uncharacterized protein n=1 Tax=Streptomyces pratisoli TaxID=3139917 RepID=A0ACC6QUH8_9ACTN|nr:MULTISPECIES: hypothetical protein [unclassified Streptomyces]MCX4515416.1 hypothetical protein [Streptomyces sp. NBC_01619]
MIPMTIGTVVATTGLIFLADSKGTATKVYAFYADFMPVGRATVNSIRFAGAIAVLVGGFWIATAVI